MVIDYTYSCVVNIIESQSHVKSLIQVKKAAEDKIRKTEKNPDFKFGDDYLPLLEQNRKVPDGKETRILVSQNFCSHACIQLILKHQIMLFVVIVVVAIVHDIQVVSAKLVFNTFRCKSMKMYISCLFGRKRCDMFR